MLQGHTDIIKALALNSRSKLLASSGRDSKIRLWEIDKSGFQSKLPDLPKSISAVAINPLVQQIIAGREDGIINYWVASTGQLQQSFSAHNGIISALACSPDGKLLASAGDRREHDRAIKLWRSLNFRTPKILAGHGKVGGALTTCLQFNKEGNQLISGGGDRTIRIWDVETGDLLLTLTGHASMLSDLALNMSKQLLASAAYDKCIKLWHSQTGELLNTWVSESKHMNVNTVCFNTDGSLLASGDGSSDLKIWDVATGKLQRTFSGHTKAIISVKFRPNSMIVLSASKDKTLRFWDCQTGKCIYELSEFNSTVDNIAWEPDGTAFICSSDRNVYYCDIIHQETTFKVYLRWLRGQAYFTCRDAELEHVVGISSNHYALFAQRGAKTKQQATEVQQTNCIVTRV